MSDDDTNFKLSEDLIPVAVVCMRGSVRDGISYDAEISFDGKHYVHSMAYASRAEAMAAAQEFVDMHKQMIRQYMKGALSGFKVAKP